MTLVSVPFTPDVWVLLCAQVQGYADKKYPRNRGAEIHITLADGRTAVVPIMPPAALAADQDERPAAGLTERQREILAVVREAGPGKRLTVDEIAHLVGCDPTSHFRTHLAAMVRLGLLVSVASGGYFLPENQGFSADREA